MLCRLEGMWLGCEKNSEKKSSQPFSAVRRYVNGEGGGEKTEIVDGKVCCARRNI